MRARVLHVSDFAAPYPGAFIRQLRMLAEELRGRGQGTMAFAFPARAEGRRWLDALRGFAALIVCVFHALPWLVGRPAAEAVRIAALSAAAAHAGRTSINVVTVPSLDAEPDPQLLQFLSSEAASGVSGQTIGSAP